jgi:hypothetical protein
MLTFVWGLLLLQAAPRTSPRVSQESCFSSELGSTASAGSRLTGSIARPTITAATESARHILATQYPEELL